MPTDTMNSPLIDSMPLIASIGGYSIGDFDLYGSLVAVLHGLKVGNILLVQASIVILIPYLLWRTLGLGRWMPLGVIQIFSGVLLGPVLLGQAFPDLFSALFGKADLHGKIVDRTEPILALATIAVCLFGFLTGADADKEVIRRSGKTVLSIGLFGMAVSWAMGSAAGAAIYYYVPAAYNAGARPVIFALAIGLVVAVSALPVLAVVLRETQLVQRRVGAVALASAGICDTVMWIGLSVLTALSGSGSIAKTVALAVTGGALSIVFVMFVASPILNRLMDREAPESATMTIAALTIFVASGITAITDLHPVLGAFVAGLFLPDRVRELAAHRLDQPTNLVLMPFFFLYTGLQTNFQFTDPVIWVLFGSLTIVCVFGKAISHGIAARAVGENWPFSMSVGILLQTKGLMDLIVLLVFLDRGIVSPLMFAAGVLMCLVSTGITTPIIRALVRVYGDRAIEGNNRAALVVSPAEPAVSAQEIGLEPALAYLEFENAARVPVTKGRSVIGRQSDCDIRLNDINVSRRHAELVLGSAGRFELHNLTADRSEANPVTVNEIPKEHAELSDGDVLGLGLTKFTFRAAHQ